MQPFLIIIFIHITIFVVFVSLGLYSCLSNVLCSSFLSSWMTLTDKRSIGNTIYESSNTF